MIGAWIHSRSHFEPPPTDESPWWEAVPWTAVIIGLLIVLVIGLCIWALLAWRRRRAAGAAPRPVGASAGQRLRSLWEPFYRRLPARARHYPTVVVLGDAGVGKTHAITARVDWRGQSSQYMASVEHGAAMQLYLGPDVVVHELSAAVLRDVGSDAKRALHDLWRNMGPSATVLLVLDARQLLRTTPQALRELAQLVRGKLSLFPARCRGTLELRVYLSHLDQIDGYEEFAAMLGKDHRGLELSSSDAAASAASLLASFDAHLAHALTTRTGDEFDRLVRFYDELPALITGLGPLLDALTGEHEPFGDRYRVRGLYLGALVPQSHVGDPFVVDRTQVAVSASRQQRRARRGSAALAAGLCSVAAGSLLWHGRRVEGAEQAVAKFRAVQDRQAQVSDTETAAATEVAAAIEAMYASEILWLGESFLDDKREIDGGFEQAIREAYLEPRLEDPDRINLLYVTALIYASNDNELGKLIYDNRVMWADELELSEWVIDAYVDASREPYDKPVDLPDRIVETGQEWSAYLLELDACLRDGLLDEDEVAKLQADLPALRGPREYEVLTEVRELLRADDDFYDRLAPLLTGSFDSWAGANHQALEQLSETLRGLRLKPGRIRGWGLAHLVEALTHMPAVGVGKGWVLGAGDEVSVDSQTLAEVILRSRRHELIVAVLESLEATRPGGGEAFFDTGARPADAGVIRGYGGGPSGGIAGYYTRDAYQARVALVLRFAEQQLAAEAAPADEAAAEGEAEAPAPEGEAGAAATPVELDLLPADEVLLDRVIRDATAAYAAAYRQELDRYWGSFEFKPGSAVALPYVIKALGQPGSWFTEFLTAVSRNAELGLPGEDEDLAGYYAPLRDALADYGPLRKLLLEDAGAIPGLEPYQGLMAALHKRLAEAATVPGDPEGEELSARLSGLGGLALGTELGTEDDYDELITAWLFGAGIDGEWWAPFLAPVDAVMAYGREDITFAVATAWNNDVRPLVNPLLDKYPFSPEANEDAGVDELETIVRRQGEVPGTFWERFDALIRPAMAEGHMAMLGGIEAPEGMLAMARDLERVSSTLWDEKGERVPLKVKLRIEPLPKEPVDGRYASMASIGAGGSSIYGFNNRPDKQALTIDWWDQGTAVVSLTMSAPVPADVALGGDAEPDERRYRVSASGTFSFYRLLDLGASRNLGARHDSITAVAMARATRCGKQGGSGTKGVTITWRVLAGSEEREVSVVVLSDPWAAFAVRRCR